ncbi:hypothetical protein [Gracilimonas mengyeensis]|uniref:Uncharacterized protein n=1 Tax=Gracilimonas mengyeensis TaxID=1302730 RepID=A0A521BAS2_9BACT|nr:hypothetical protein [Gracilimonas mengyeensis]SMO44175.1 hypothetical protein SAMN06265219_102138 [Gracilimonas mengyeensis]
METIKINRKIDSTHLQIDELSNWMGKEVDIIIKEKPSKPTSVKNTAAGLLSDFKNKTLIETEKKGWAKAVREKHGNR